MNECYGYEDNREKREEEEDWRLEEVVGVSGWIYGEDIQLGKRSL